MSGLTERIAAACAADGEFNLMARYWTGALRLGFGDEVVEVRLVDGVVAGVDALEGAARASDGPGSIGVAAPAALWDKILAAVPPPFCNDIVPAAGLGLVISGDDVTFWQYYPAVRRLVELLRAGRSGPAGA